MAIVDLQVTSISKTTGSMGGTLVTLTGNGFHESAKVYWDGIECPLVEYVSETELTVRTPRKSRLEAKSFKIV